MFCPQCRTSNPTDAKFCQNCGATLTAAAATTWVSADVPPVLAEPQYAGFWMRFAAYLIDGFLLGIVGVILEAVMGRPGSIVNFIMDWVYFAAMESSSKQATLGKMALGLRVTDLGGQRISFGRATGRYFAKILSALILCIGYMMAGWTQKKQALHDLIASTLVVRRSW